MFVEFASIGAAILLWGSLNKFLYKTNNYQRFFKFDPPPFIATLNNANLNDELQSLVYGQSADMAELGHLISYTTHGIHVFFFVGGPGVGKTYGASLIKKHYEPKDEIVSIFPSAQSLNDASLLTSTTKTIRRIKSGPGLVVIDRIRFNSPHLMQFLKHLSDFSKEHGKWVIVIVVGDLLKTHSQDGYKTVDQFDSKESYEGFLRAATKYYGQFYGKYGNFNYDIIMFQPLTAVEVRQCINSALQRQNKRLTSDKIQGIVDRLVTKDFALVGCKDVDSYVMLSTNNFDAS